MRRWLRREAENGSVGVMHSHGLWMMPNVYPARACADTGCRIVVSPRGTLSSWALDRHALQKKAFWRIAQASALNAATCFHATADAEFEDIRRAGFRQPICVLRNGVDVPIVEARPTGGPRQLLYLGRIHPVKGIDILLHAWHAVQQRFPDWELNIAGPDNGGYLTAIKGLASQLGLERVCFLGPLYGDQKVRAYRAASVFVLPTHSENFALTVAEALGAGTPAIVTTGAPWESLEKQDAGWWIQIGVDPLIACLTKVLALPSLRLAAMGQAGREWMVRDYSWRQIGEQLSIVYSWLIEGGDTPASVTLN
jgi:glycosyltransferase involved in cell wall biosynthesis